MNSHTIRWLFELSILTLIVYYGYVLFERIVMLEYYVDLAGYGAKLALDRVSSIADYINHLHFDPGN